MLQALLQQTIHYCNIYLTGHTLTIKIQFYKTESMLRILLLCTKLSPYLAL